MLRLLETWITSRPIRKVRVSFGEDSIELEQASSEDQWRLVDAFVAAHLPISSVQPDRDDAPSGT